LKKMGVDKDKKSNSDYVEIVLSNADKKYPSFGDVAKDYDGVPKYFEKIDRELSLDLINEPDFEDLIIAYEGLQTRLPDEKKEKIDIKLFSILSQKERDDYEDYLLNVPIKKMSKLHYEEYKDLTPTEKVNKTIPVISEKELGYGFQYEEKTLDAIFNKQNLMLNEYEMAHVWDLSLDEKTSLIDKFSRTMHDIGLTQKQTDIAFWRMFWGEKVSEKWIAEIFNISQQAVSKQIKSIEKKLKKTKHLDELNLK
jgi:predicted DNA-binding protein YlxM (UPF0122 family)